jgi:hypothetical protein
MHPNTSGPINHNQILPQTITGTLGSGGGNCHTIGPSSAWLSIHDRPEEKHYATARKLLADPEFDVGKILLEMVARYLHWAESEQESEKLNDPVVQKYLKEDE